MNQSATCVTIKQNIFIFYIKYIFLYKFYIIDLVWFLSILPNCKTELKPKFSVFDPYTKPQRLVGLFKI